MHDIFLIYWKIVVKIWSVSENLSSFDQFPNQLNNWGFSEQRSNNMADLDLTMDPQGRETFQISMGRGNFKKYFLIYSFLCKLLTRISIQVSIIGEDFLQNWGPMTSYYGFKVKLMVFLAMTNCFRKSFCTSQVLLSFVILFAVHWLSLPNQKNNWFSMRNKWT